MSVTKVSAVCGMALAVVWFGSQSGRAQGSDVITACVGAAGQTRIVDAAATCRPAETRVTWNVTGPKGDKGDPGDPAPAGGGGLHVVDANGTDLGLFSVVNAALLVPRPGHDGFWLQIPVVAEGFGQAGNQSFVFKTPCPAGGGLHAASERYLFAAGVGPGPATTQLTIFASPVGNTAYFPSLTTEMFGPLSQENTNVSTGVTTCSNAAFPSGRYALVETATLPAALAPFKLVLK